MTGFFASPTQKKHSVILFLPKEGSLEASVSVGMDTQLR